MNREQLKSRIHQVRNKSASTYEISDAEGSIFKARIASLSEQKNTVPLTTPNCGLPIFVKPKIYLDARHLSSLRISKVTQHDDLYRVTAKLSFQGCERLNLIAENIDLAVVIFVDNYPVLKLDMTQQLFNAEFDMTCFSSEEQAQYFVREVQKFKSELKR